MILFLRPLHGPGEEDNMGRPSFILHVIQFKGIEKYENTSRHGNMYEGNV